MEEREKEQPEQPKTIVKSPRNKALEDSSCQEFIGKFLIHKVTGKIPIIDILHLEVTEKQLRSLLLPFAVPPSAKTVKTDLSETDLLVGREEDSSEKHELQKESEQRECPTCLPMSFFDHETKAVKERSYIRRKSEFVLQNALEIYINMSVWTETLIHAKEYYMLTEGCDSPIAAITPNVLHKLIVSNTKVPIKTFMITVAGLPGCDKSQPLMKMLNEVVSTAQIATQLGIQQKDDGVVVYELAAVGKPLTQLEQPRYSETTSNTCYLYAFESALKYHYMQNSKLLWRFDPAQLKQNFFDDTQLNDKFASTFHRLHENHRDPSQSLQWFKKIPNDLALFNIWDIRLNKSAFHFLPALWGHLDRSYMWLFLNLDRDVDSLFELPDISDNECRGCQVKDKELLMCYRTRLHYFLRYAMLLKSKRCKDRKDVCSVFGMHEELCEESIDHLRKELTNAATQMKIEKLIDTENIRLLQPDRDDKEVLKRELDSIVNKILASKDVVPLRYIFLRSLYYELDKMYITKEELRVKARQLEMSDSDLEEFCQFFMSGCSIIDINQINSDCPYVIMKPKQFLSDLDKIFYPQSNVDSRVIEYGLVTNKTAKVIFHEDHYQFFMDVLVSVDLAMMLRGDQICLEVGPLIDEVCYYVPDVRIQSPNLICDPSALHLLLDVNCPLCHLQAAFAKEYLAISNNSSLVVKKNDPINITSFRVEQSNGEIINFEMIYHGEAVEFRVPKCAPFADEDTCANIIRACNQMMEKDKWLKTKYIFAVMCSSDPFISDANHLRHVRHILPLTKDACDSCKENDRYNESLDTWNKVVEKNNVPEERVQNGRVMSITDISAVAEKLKHLSLESFDILKEGFVKYVSNRSQNFPGGNFTRLMYKLKTGEEKVKEKKFPLRFLMEWEEELRQAGKPEEASKRSLARLLMNISYNISIKVDKEILISAARRLDLQVTQVLPPRPDLQVTQVNPQGKKSVSQVDKHKYKTSQVHSNVHVEREEFREKQKKYLLHKDAEPILTLEEGKSKLEATSTGKTQTFPEVELFKKSQVHMNEQIKELQSLLKIKEERMKELEAALQQVLPVLPDISSDIFQDDPGIHVAKQKVFHIKGNTLDWGDYGFKMYFPEGTIPPSKVLIKALVGGKFQFPDGMELVSALYVIKFPEEFIQPVELQIQHCVCLKNSRQFEYLSFIIAPIDESVPPYKFQFIEGGKFYTDSQYGMIVRSRFCITGIAKKTNGRSPLIGKDDPPLDDIDPSSDSETQSTSEDADVQSNGDSSSEDKDPSSDSDSDTETQSTSEQAVQSSKNDESYTDDIEVRKPNSSDKQETHHKFPGDSDAHEPENIYTGGMYYQKIGSNKWWLRFMVTQKVDAFLQYIKDNHIGAIPDEVIRFSFQDPVSGHIQLNIFSIEQVVCRGWRIEPHKEPLILSKRDADLFGSKDLPIPPSCLITVWAKLSCDPEERLRHPVTMDGIDCKVERIYISRFLEEVETSNMQGKKANTPQTTQPDIPTHTVSCNTTLTNISLSTLRSNYGDLCSVLNVSQPTLFSLATELFSKGIIDTNVMMEVFRERGVVGANMLLIHVLMKIEGNAEYLDVVQKTLEKEESLRDIMEKMKRHGQT